MGYGVTTRMGRFPIQTPLGARPDLRTQLRYEVPGDRDEIVENAVINIGSVRLFSAEWPKVGYGTAK